MQVSVRTSLVLVVYHLHSYKAIAKALSDQVQSALKAFLVSVACQTRLIHRGFTTAEADIMFNEISPNDPFHLAVIFLTEGDPQGGWWHTSAHGHQKDSTVCEEDFLSTCLVNLEDVAERAVTARIFGVSCGYNLKVNGTINSIVRFLERTPYQSFVTPSTSSLLMCDYIPIFPEIFLNLYYFGTALEPALYRVWGKSKEARSHTGLMLFTRSPESVEMQVKAISYAPIASRPLGVPLPLLQTICGCDNDGMKWSFKKTFVNGLEAIFIYRAPCCQVELQVGIYPGNRQKFVQHEMHFVVENWDRESDTFTFNDSDNVKMKILPPRFDGKPSLVCRDRPWTTAGINAAKMEEQFAEYMNVNTM
ncbi:hypothetical protein RHS01_09347 [Rhizoctonia solani]|uniref:Uncharacterized protein n=1 Tax=Rhizoctonia solani TaxID=456999 RepID=A0A8H7I3H3_9AGAM|nr:hypothetical protein RHS01_09347 [Rhizoctonia solani]